MSRHRNIEEEFRAIAPAGRRGIPGAQPIAVGVTGSGGVDSTASMSQASAEIAQLEAQFKQQASVIQANTEALLGNTTAHTGQSIAGVAVGAVTGGLGGGLGGVLGILSPIVTGLMSLFGGGSSSSTPAALPFYSPPPSVQISDTLRTPAGSGVAGSSGASESGAGGSGAGGSGASGAKPQAAPSTTQTTHITVNVSAMDSQSFMDRSGDIASAVREAMLNLHPINDVVAGL